MVAACWVFMILPFLLRFNLFKHWRKMIGNHKGKGFFDINFAQWSWVVGFILKSIFRRDARFPFFSSFFISISCLFRFHFWPFFNCLCKCKGTSLPLNFSIKTCWIILGYCSLLLISYFPKLKRMSYWPFSLLRHSDWHFAVINR